MQQKVLITGGTGFLGIHLARRFLKEGWEVTLFDLHPLENKELANKVQVMKGDIRKPGQLEKAIRHVTHVIHAAAAVPVQQNKQKIFSTNIEGTKHVLEVALKHKIKRVIYVSSTAIHGIPRQLPLREDSPLKPLGNYGRSKVEAEKLCHEYMKKGLEVTVLRPRPILGPERLGVFTLWFEAIYTGHRVFILGKGKNKYQLLAVSDAVDAIYKAVTSPITNETFTIGAKEFQNWQKDLRFLIRSEKSSSRITSLPVWPSQIILRVLGMLHLSPLAAIHYKTIPHNSYSSTEKAERLLKWYPKKSNRDLLLESYLWYKKNRNKIQKRTGETHKVSWNFKLLTLISKL